MTVVSEPTADGASVSGSAPRATSRVPLRCVECGYEIASYQVVPPCPMCREVVWEPAPWRPFTRSRAA